MIGFQKGLSMSGGCIGFIAAIANFAFTDNYTLSAISMIAAIIIFILSFFYNENKNIIAITIGILGVIMCSTMHLISIIATLLVVLSAMLNFLSDK